ncbi:hypothetical protein Bealeia1_02027 (plasmid) [Candidatus Bealeia paramacronuclearis]|uniref:Uncharacterized protein n=1 Tax=Candidatus Bealeia paramacronuclearis TaxID=1921001 RepID=A0ABZ2C675_9PROT
MHLLISYLLLITLISSCLLFYCRSNKKCVFRFNIPLFMKTYPSIDRGFSNVKNLCSLSLTVAARNGGDDLFPQVFRICFCHTLLIPKLFLKIYLFIGEGLYLFLTALKSPPQKKPTKLRWASLRVAEAGRNQFKFDSFSSRRRRFTLSSKDEANSATAAIIHLG